MKGLTQLHSLRSLMAAGLILVLGSGSVCAIRRCALACGNCRTARIPLRFRGCASCRHRFPILNTRLDEEFIDGLRQALEKNIGPEGSYGVFVRSDTNVEDLPERFPPITDDDGNPAPADIKFGFLDGRLQLEQLRPFLESRDSQGGAYLSDMDKSLQGRLNRTVDMQEVPGS